MNSNWRLSLISWGFFWCVVLLLSRLFYWQVLNRDRLALLASSQQQTTLEVPAKRGEILSSDQHFLVANQPAYLAYLTRTNEPFADDLSQKLAPILSATSASQQAQTLLEERLNDSQIRWLALARRLTQEQKWQLESLGLDNLYFEATQTRLYPEASMAAHLLGFVGFDSTGKETGYYGLEGFYQAELAGQPGLIRQERDAFDQPILSGRFLKQSPRGGRSLKLHLNRSLQFLVERKLLAGIDRYGAQAGSVTVMDPLSGAILAMASFPSYEPVEYQRFKPDFYPNPVISQAFEPGSVFKVVIMAAALDSGAVKPETVCDICSGPVKIDKYTINTWDNHYRPDSTVTEVIVNSDNVGMVFVGQKLGLDKFLEYFNRFGFYDKTGIDLQDEVIPEQRPQAKWSYVDLATASFGQGFVATGMQLLQAVAAIATGGELVTPKVVAEVIDENRTIPIPSEVKRRVISPETAKKLTEMMVAAAKSGEAKWTFARGYKIAGKTGTAQVAVGGRYSEEKTNASFIGFAPADKPKFVMLVTLKEPSSSPWASETAAPLWFSIAVDLLNHFNVVPENP